jgi:hypothetical protein
VDNSTKTMGFVRFVPYCGSIRVTYAPASDTPESDGFGGISGSRKGSLEHGSRASNLPERTFEPRDNLGT